MCSLRRRNRKCNIKDGRRKNSYLNFVNKKLLVELHPNKDEENLIKDIIAKIDSIEPGLDIQVVDKSAKKLKQ